MNEAAGYVLPCRFMLLCIMVPVFQVWLWLAIEYRYTSIQVPGCCYTCRSTGANNTGYNARAV